MQSDGYSMSSVNPENIALILSQAFNEVLASIGNQHEISIHAVDENAIQVLEFKTVICSIAAATFKINILVHFPIDNKSMNEFIKMIDTATNRNTKEQYIDYVSEKINTLCGAVNRVLGGCGFTSGMSTPVMLNIPNSTSHMGLVGAECETHIGCYFQNIPIIFASLYLILNNGFDGKLNLTVQPKNENENENESAGELEFF